MKYHPRINHPTVRFRCVAQGCGRFVSFASADRQGFWAFCRKHELTNRAAQLAYSRLGLDHEVMEDMRPL